MISVSLTDACRDPDLFALDLWPAQRKMAAALDDGVGLLVAALGRRSGKTTLAAAALVHDALLRPECDAFVRPGETRYAVAVATRLDQARQLVAAARTLVEASPVLRGYLVSATEDQLLFVRNGHRTAVLALPCSSRAGRGLATSRIVPDEFAHFQSDSEGPATASRVWAGLSPGLAQFGDLGQAIVISTPMGDDNLFAKLHANASDGTISRAVALSATTLEANPTISPGWIAAQRSLLSPAEFAAEFEASFAAATGDFIDLGQVRRIAVEPSRADDFIVGLDPGQRDGFGLVVVGSALDPPARLCVVHVEALDAGSFTGAVDSAARVAERFGAPVVTDQFSGAMVAERLRSLGVFVQVRPWSASSSSSERSTAKFPAYADLRSRLYEGRVELLDDPALLRELGALRVRADSGSWRVSSPRRHGSHGDLASALALAVAHAHEPPERRAWLSDEERDRVLLEEALAEVDLARRQREMWGGDAPPLGWTGGSVMSGIRDMQW